MLLDSPAGTLFLCADEEYLYDLRFGGDTRGYKEGETPVLLETARQLKAYFAGELKEFSLPVRPEGTPFQQRCWQALTEIPYGETVAYSDIAARIGNPKACRAVGLANNRNPISIIIPCHRVVGKNGALTGYGGGLSTKELLLDLERRVLAEGK